MLVALITTGAWVIKSDDGAKLAPKLTGPFQVTAVHANGNCTIRRAPTVLERVNVRRLRPYLA